MSRNELIAKIETLQTLEALIEETKAEAETVRNSIKIGRASCRERV